MVKSLITELPKIVERGKKEAERILNGLSKKNKITLQTNELVLPTKAKGGLFDFTGQAVKGDVNKEWLSRLVYGDNLFYVVNAKEMSRGKLTYGDEYIRDGNKTYHRKDGKIKYNGKWHEEGSMAFPWEKRAKKAEKQTAGKFESNKLPDGRPGSSAYQKRNDV